MADRIIAALGCLMIVGAMLFGILCIAANQLWKASPPGGDDDWRVE